MEFYHLLLILAVTALPGLAEKVYYPSAYQHRQTVANVSCQRIGGSLAKVDTIKIYNHIVTLMFKFDLYMVLLGGTEQGVAGDWKWPDLTMVNWTILPGGPDKPTQTNNNAMVVERQHDNVQVTDAVDYTNAHYMCEIDTGNEEVVCPWTKTYFRPPLTDSWIRAQIICRELGGDLAMANNQHQAWALVVMSRRYEDDGTFWLGGQEQSDSLLWTDETQVNTALFKSFTPATQYPACLQVFYTSLLISSGNCDAAAQFICERPLGVRREHGDVCFWKGRTAMDFTSSQDYCEGQGGHLAKLENQEELWLAQPSGVMTSGTNGPTELNGQFKDIYTWHDGSPFTLVALLPSNPQELAHQQVVTFPEDSFKVSTRIPASSQAYKPLCERDISGAPTIYRKELLNETVSFTTARGYIFTDGTTQRVYNCSNPDLLTNISALQTIRLEESTQMVRAGWYKPIPLHIPPVYSNNPANCTDITQAFISLRRIQLQYKTQVNTTSTFTVPVVAGFSSDYIAVATTTAILEPVPGPGGGSGWLKRSHKCELYSAQGSEYMEYMYKCRCDVPCYVTLTLRPAPAHTEPLHVCAFSVILPNN